MTNQPSYRFRRNLFERERTVSLTDDGLRWSDGRAEGRIAYSEMAEIRIYSVMGTQYSPASWRCLVYPVGGRKTAVSSLHFAGLGDFEDRHPAMLALCRELIARAAPRNRSIRFIAGLPRATWFMALFYLAVVIACVVFGGIVFAMLLLEAKLSAIAALVTAGALVGFSGIAYAIWRWLKRSWPRPFDPFQQDPFAISGGDTKPPAADAA